MTMYVPNPFPLTSANILAAVRRERMAKRGVHATQNSFHWLVSEYLASSKFRSLALNTQDGWGRYLGMAANVLGSALLKAETKKDEDRVIRPKLVLDFLGALSDRPSAAAVALAALRAVSKWGQVSDLLPRDITAGVSVPQPEGGHVPWTDEQIDLAITHARPDLARVILLASCTGQRRSDLIKMCWSDITMLRGRQGINVVQKKTGKQLWIPINDVLAAALATWERRPGRILLDRNGQPWTEKGVTKAWIKERKRNPALSPLAGLVLHGLRGYVCVRLQRAGCETLQIADMVGMSEHMVKRYTRLSSNAENNLATVLQLENFRGTKLGRAENE